MFDAYCSACEARMLFGPRRMLRLFSTTPGMVAIFRCYCGQVGAEWFGVARKAVA